MAAITRQGLDISLDLSGTLIVYENSEFIKAVSEAADLRKKGERVCMIEYNPQITDSQYAEYAQGSMLERTIFLKKDSIIGGEA